MMISFDDNTCLDEHSARGDGWALASFPSAAAAATFLPQITPFVPTWVGASDATEEGRWRWTDGRLKNAAFSSGGDCLAVRYRYLNGDGVTTALMANKSADCLWDKIASAANPDGGATQNCAAFAVISGAPKAMTDEPCGDLLRCFACERSACSALADCSPVGAIGLRPDSIGAYYPNCKCECKAGFFGDHCEMQHFEHPSAASAAWHVAEAYQSDYGVWCHPDGPQNHAASAAACRARGSGWDLATFPTPAAAFAVRQHLPTTFLAHMWYGGSDSAVDAEWRWTTGRLKGVKFSQGATCVDPYRFLPIFLTVGAFGPCTWHTTEPNGGAWENCAMLDNDFIHTEYLTNDAHCEAKPLPPRRRLPRPYDEEHDRRLPPQLFLRVQRRLQRRYLRHYAD